MQKTVLTSLLLGIGLTACSRPADEPTTTLAGPTSVSAPLVVNKTLVEIKIPDIKLPEGNKPLDCRLFRLRILDLAAGKKVGIHSHENRPGALSVAGGKGMTVYAYNHPPVDVPYGGSYKSYNDIVHYATNSSETEKLSIMTSDFLDDGSPCDGRTFPQNTPIAEKLETEKDSFFVNAPQGAEENEVNHEYFRTHLRDVKLPDGSTPMKERSLRISKVTMAEGASIGATNYANRPSYIMNLQGVIQVKNADANTVETLKAKEAANLINAGSVEIVNSGSAEAAYFVIELADPNDGKTIN